MPARQRLGNDTVFGIGTRRRDQLKETPGAPDINLDAAGIAQDQGDGFSGADRRTRYGMQQVADLDSEAHP